MVDEKEQSLKRRGVLYIITCATPAAGSVQDFVPPAQDAGWDVCVILTPQATKFVDISTLEQRTGHPVRSNYKEPDDPDVLPRADAIVVYGATFNTINKWALGISDNLALGLLCEYTGLKKPILAFPVVRQGGGLDTHPAFPRNLELLKNYGVSIIYEPETYPPRNH
ncbi:MAG TPA: flavoprotein, partial [Ktedonobacteraceae bacterium]|nr:flavoprotein [Ktedonobacteraceae bacterium]